MLSGLPEACCLQCVCQVSLNVQADHSFLLIMLRQLEGTWASGCDELLSLMGPQLISLLDPDRVIELQIRVEVLQALASALVRASQVLLSALASCISPPCYSTSGS